MRKLFVFALTVWLGFSTLNASASTAKTYTCPNVDIAHQAFKSGAAKEWPNYSEADAARVQRQHPNTAIIAAHAKFISTESGKFAVCQYYTHVGLLLTTGFVVAGKSTEKTEGYWRSEYTKSTPERDVKGREMLEVCMENMGNYARPSVNCKFELSTK